MQNLQVENPLKKLDQLGALNPAVNLEKSLQVSDNLVVRYEMYNVGDPQDKSLLCEAKTKILKNGYPYNEQTTFDKEGNWIVALNWYEET